MRSRNIKPGFFDNDELLELPPLARLLFAGLWVYCDRRGGCEDQPKKIKRRLLPNDACNCNELLQLLADTVDEDGKPFIIRYAVDGEKYIQVTNFEKHQTPHCKEAESIIPAPESQFYAQKPGASTVPAPDKHRASTPYDTYDSLDTKYNPPISPLGDGGGEAPELQLLPPPSPEKPVPDDGYSPLFKVAWRRYPVRKTDSKADGSKKFEKTLKEFPALDTTRLLRGIDLYRDDLEASGKLEYATGFARFFGPARLWEPWYERAGADMAQPSDQDTQRQVHDVTINGADAEMLAALAYEAEHKHTHPLGGTHG